MKRRNQKGRRRWKPKEGDLALEFNVCEPVSTEPADDETMDPGLVLILTTFGSVVGGVMNVAGHLVIR